MAARALNPGILREYDIRGIYAETLTEDDAYAVGRSYGSTARAGGAAQIAVGYDGRASSPALEAALTEGLVACGLEVRRIGLGPTPMLYFATHHLGVDGGVMVTGSHNPPNYNGLKMVLQGASLHGQAIQALGKLAAAGDWIGGRGRMRSDDVFADYVAMLRRTYASERPVDVVWDCGHGATGDVVTALVATLPGRHRVLYGRIDGSFPAHHPDPTVAENLHDLIEAVTRGGYQIGIAFDGDGDRIGIVDGRGRIVWGDQIATLLALEVLKERPGAQIVADVKSSQVLFDEVARAGGSPVMWKTGHSLIKTEMKRLNAPFGGEMTGHIFFADRFYGHDDAIYVALRFLEMLARNGTTAADLLDRLPKMNTTPEFRIDCPDERKFAIVEEVKRRLDADGSSFNAIDGIRAQSDDGWWLLRASNTQPALVLRCEARTAEALEALKATVNDRLLPFGLSLPNSN
jgi:phosphomannomutase